MGEVRIPDMLERVSVEALIPYVNNARTHSDAQVAQLAASIMKFGWTNPCIIDADGVILAGHGRVAAARKLGLSEVPCIRVPLSGAEARAYILADNRLAELAGWDLELLKVELDYLKEQEFDLGLIGFDEEALAKMFPEIEVLENGKDPDDAPPVPEVPHSKEGDLWILGPHRVICGSSTDVHVWERLMQGEMADACWCDPPYNVAYNSKLAGSIKNDDMGDKEFFELIHGMFSSMFTVLKPGAAIYVAHADTEGLNFRRAFREAGFKLSGCIIWEKDSLVLGRSDYQWMHEPILYGWKPGSSHRWYGGRKRTTISKAGLGGPIQQAEDGRWLIKVGDSVLVVDGEAHLEESPSSLVFCPKPKRSADHPTMKPTELIEKQLGASARPGDITIDCCGGSGSTLIASERLGMCARLVELDPKFVDVICRRYHTYTGRKPVHAVTGEEFPV